MGFRRRVAELDLVVVLLVIGVVELALNRLAVPVLRPPGDVPPPGWHKDLDVAGLFVFHLTSMLALGVGAWKTIELARARTVARAVRVGVVLVALAFLVLAGAGILLPATPDLTFHLESAFALFLLLLGLVLALRPADARVKLGLLVIAVPFLLHYYATFALRLFMTAEVARASGLPDRMRSLGQWSVAIAAIVVAFCFAPRPLRRAVGRQGPLVLAGFVALIVTTVMLRHQDVGMEIAWKGLGIDVGPGTPVGIVGAFVVAAAAATWTLASTLTSELPARRAVGAGYALVLLGGYAYAWPLQMLTVIAGALTIVEGGARLQADDAEPADVADVRTPPIPAARWQAYVEALARALGARVEVTSQASAEETRLAGERDGLPYRLLIHRRPQGVHAIDLAFGRVPTDEEPAGTEPAWTLQARPEGVLGAATHPPPPPTSAPLARTGDGAFDERFRLHDAGALSDRLLDEGLRARATAVLDGWIALWPGEGLRYRVHPGRGAPLDHPIPISELAFRGGDTPSPARLVNVFELLHEMAIRAVAPPAARG